jgi:ferredoxin
MLAVFGKLGFMTITHERTTCIDCKIGEKNCPIGIDPNAETAITSAECIQCMECVAACPVHKAIHVEVAGHRLKPVTIGMSIVASFLIVIGVAQLLGYWQTKGDRARMTRDVETMGAEAIRGWMTLEDVRGLYGMEPQQFRELLGLPPDLDLDTQLRELEGSGDESLPDPERIREILSDYQPVQAGIGGGQTEGRGEGSGRGPGGGAEGRPFIRGNTTLREALEMSGKTLEDFRKDWKIEAVPDARMRDLADQLHTEMWDLREYFGQRR